ncbi:MAG: formylmethanofuran dehydrogenase subunit B [Candidatus Methylomirabilota bacterium]|nr:formylmethanofuran dehydrogenase subunit B [candidate division NC10 bacterium]PWB47978.1 MAG: formylmethanofuran dehydrogenase subunit B [candidate division NC10 bacterium]
MQGLQTVGLPTCTVGEIQNRADLVVYWGSNPAEAHPRHPSRYAVTAKGLFTPTGKKGRTIITIDVRPTASARMADIAFQITPNTDYEVATSLTALVNGHELNRAEVGGVPVAEWKALADKLKNCKFGIICWGMGITMSRGKTMNAIALLKLAQALNRFTKFSGMPMRGHGNVVGIAQVLTWQTGYPFAVNFSRGYPRYNPGEFSVADLVARREVDAAMIMAADAVGHLPGRTSEHLRSIPLIAIDPKESDTTKVATVVIPVAQSAVAAAGMQYRMDHIPLKQKKVVDSPWPTDREVLEQIIAKVVAMKNGK